MRVRACTRAQACCRSSLTTRLTPYACAVSTAIESYKRKTVVPWENRKRLIEAIKGVDLVVPQTTLDYAPNLEWLRPAFVVHGSDWNNPKGPQFATRQKVIDTLAQWDGQLIEPPYTGGVSTTDIINVSSPQLAQLTGDLHATLSTVLTECMQVGIPVYRTRTDLHLFRVLLRPSRRVPRRRTGRQPVRRVRIARTAQPRRTETGLKFWCVRTERGSAQTEPEHAETRFTFSTAHGAQRAARVEALQ